MKSAFPPAVLYVIVGLLLAANTINLAADLAAMGEATRLLIGGSTRVYCVVFGVICLVLQVFLRYHAYVRYLKWLTLALLAYVGVIFTTHIPWGEVLRGLVLPHVRWDHDTIAMVVAVFGTTISPYLFFWQAAQEVEGLNGSAHSGMKAEKHAHLRLIRWDTYIGMGFSNFIALCIMMGTAATLHGAGITHIDTAAQAAEALRPVGGAATFLLFSLGIIGTGMLAVPVLAGSAAYAVAESFNWSSGLDSKVHEARGFYGILAAATIGGVALNFTHLDPIRALVFSAEINGVVAAPIMVIMMLLASRHDVMGDFVIRPRLRAVGWAATAVMGATVVALFVT